MRYDIVIKLIEYEDDGVLPTRTVAQDAIATALNEDFATHLYGYVLSFANPKIRQSETFSFHETFMEALNRTRAGLPRIPPINFNVARALVLALRGREISHVLSHNQLSFITDNEMLLEQIAQVVGYHPTRRLLDDAWYYTYDVEKPLGGKI